MSVYFLKSTFRNFVKYKSSFLINLISLTVSFACAILIFLWVNDEMQVDRFHKTNKQLYQVLENHDLQEGIMTQTWTPDMLGRTFAVEMPEVEMQTSIMPAFLLGKFSLTSGDKKIKADGQFADKDLFSVFSFPLIQGDAEEVLKNKDGIVISKQLATSLFGTTENVIGKAIDWELLNFKNQVVVSGIFEGTPKNSTIQFDFALSFDAWMELSQKVGRNIDWGNHAPCTYLVLKENTDIKQFNAKIENYLKTKTGNSNIRLFVVPFSSQYLHGKFENGEQVGGRISYVNLFSLIAVFILLIAGINFMNLTTARASGRFKEIGIKKVVGSGRWSLIVQFVSESVILTFFALLVSLAVVYFMLPIFNQITAKNLVFGSHLQFILILPVIAFLLAVATGLYPALYLSGFNSLQTLKAKFSNPNGEAWARKGLVVFQFVISVVLIISVIVVYRQVEFIRNKNLGYNKNHVVFFENEGEIANHQEAFLQEAGKIPGVKNISGIGGNLIGSFASTYDVNWPEKSPGSNIRFEVIPVGYNLIETLEMKLAEGRSFSEDFKNDKEKIILNEKAVEIMGLNDPIGKTVRFWGQDKQIIGVLKNFNFESLKEEINPLLFYLEPEKTLKIMARIEAGQEAKVLKSLATLYSEFNKGFEFDYQFMDAAWNAQYEAETRVGILSRLFAVLGIFISCLGLFGLASFAAEKRIKEIGIRKVNGAKISEVMTMLNKEFIRWVLVAFVIATPVSWYILHKWLESYAYKTNLSWWIFVLAGTLALGIALLTVSFQSWKAATRNPVESLRYE